MAKVQNTDLKVLIQNLEKKIEVIEKTLLTPKQDFSDLINIFKHICASQKKELEKTRKKNEELEFYMRNVLVAIRQTDYLKAWYPPQGGYGELKVAGMHPIQKRRLDEKRANTAAP